MGVGSASSHPADSVRSHSMPLARAASRHSDTDIDLDRTVEEDAACARHSWAWEHTVASSGLRSAGLAAEEEHVRWNLVVKMKCGMVPEYDRM